MGAVGAAQAAIPSNIQFDGYCDGMTGLAKVGTGATGTWSNLDCAGTNAAVGGPQGKGKGESAVGFIMGSYGANVYGAEFTWVVNKDGTWTVYRANDGAYINHGTWSAVAEGAAPRGGKPSVAK
ncbi:hypothetical protein AACH06_06515 [Ideonella sp. DXS29W]|uniref:Uncharacterized protein n=1 Tax=Ideonella lacteola TaxID=2984193 RepID=A0ABU9BKI2_9BURK